MQCNANTTLQYIQHNIRKGGNARRNNEHTSHVGWRYSGAPRAPAAVPPARPPPRTSPQRTRGPHRSAGTPARGGAGASPLGGSPGGCAHNWAEPSHGDNKMNPQNVNGPGFIFWRDFRNLGGGLQLGEESNFSGRPKQTLAGPSIQLQSNTNFLPNFIVHVQVLSTTEVFW